MIKKTITHLLILSFIFCLLTPLIGLCKEKKLSFTITIVSTKRTEILKEKIDGKLCKGRIFINYREVVVSILDPVMKWNSEKKEFTIIIGDEKLIHPKGDVTIITYNLIERDIFLINGYPYYYIDSECVESYSKLNLPIRVILEPFYQIKWGRNGNIDTVWAYENRFYNRVKLLSKSSEVIINYEPQKLKSELIKQNKEVFIPLREFIELMEGKIEYNPISEYNSPEVLIKPANIKRDIKIYPQLNKAILINRDNETSYEKEIIFSNKLINKKGSYFIEANDLILVLQAEKHTYLDSDINIYFNFEF